MPQWCNTIIRRTYGNGPWGTALVVHGPQSGWMLSEEPMTMTGI